jgi:hypothetical protein
MGVVPDEYVAVTRVVADPDGIEELQAVVVPAARSDAPWTELVSEHAVDQWASPLSLPGQRLTREERTATMLSELGWEMLGQRSGPEPFRVRRSLVAFRAHRVSDDRGEGQTVVVTFDTGDTVAHYPCGADDPPAVLARHGWGSTGPLPGWPAGSYGVRALDWPLVVGEVTEQRDRTRKQAQTQDRGWQAAVREAVLAGQDVRRLSELTGLTRQRIYQIRDGRR